MDNLDQSRDRLMAQLSQSARQLQRERDREWREWFDRHGMFEAIKYPELGRPPSERTTQDILAIIQRSNPDD
jgi:hypothetical protein